MGQMMPRPRANHQIRLWDDYFPYVVLRPRNDDGYLLAGTKYVAFDCYCADPGCTCGAVDISFSTEDGESAGEVELRLRGRPNPRLAPAPGRRHDLQRLWQLWVARNGGDRAYLRDCNRAMKAAAREFLDRGLIMPR